MTKRLTVARMDDGRRYLASKGWSRVLWTPDHWPPRRDEYVTLMTPGFKAAVEEASLGVACRKCGYLEFEHNVDGDEKAPCRGFEEPGKAGPAAARRGGK